jgi:transcription antitermination protein NusB
MLSRRNVRIKVLQILYANNRDPRESFDQMMKEYKSAIWKTYEVYLYCLHQYCQVVKCSEADFQSRQTKQLPTDQDRSFTAKLSQNDVFQGIVKHSGFQRLISEYGLETRLDENIDRILYQQFLVSSPIYKDYLAQAVSTNEDHRVALLGLFKMCSIHEGFNELMDDNYPSWNDDKSLVFGTIKKVINAYKPSAEATVEFGENFLKDCYVNESDYTSHIYPTLKNWDPERVAVIDMILLKMAVCEMLTCPTIPGKVTINEYVEISKLYSTDKSRDFINGVLDRVMKKLEVDGLLQKQGRGLN